MNFPSSPLRASLVALIFCALTHVVSALEENGYVFTVTGGSATITGYTGAGGNVTIPTTLGGNAVIAIGTGAFASNASLTSVTIPSGVTHLGDSAFSQCSILANVSIPNSVISIENYAFDNCVGLTGITIPASVTSIGDSAFANCSSLTRADFLGNNAPSMGTAVFDGTAGGFKVYYSYYTSQTGFTTPTWSGYATGNLYPFTTADVTGGIAITDYPTATAGGLVIPATLDGKAVVEIGSSAFRDCSFLTSITIPNSVTSIKDFAFQECQGLTSMTLPSSITSIADSMFYGCFGLTSITIPNGVTTIGMEAFYYCVSLTSVTIPNSVTSIGSAAFMQCADLTNLTIPNSVTTIAKYAFSGCAGLTSLTIPDSVTSIGVEVFSGCSSLASVILPNSITSIEESTFAYCGLTSLTIPNSVTRIGLEAFFSCSSLTSLTIPNSVTTIEDHAFRLCSGLTNVKISGSVTSIGIEAFDDCSKLTRVDFLGNAPTMGTGVFAGVAAGFKIHRNEGATGFTGTPWNTFNIVINTRPLANPKSVYPLRNTAMPVVLSGRDPEKNELTYRILSVPTKGKLSGTPPKLTYKPNKDVIGSDSFTFVVNDGMMDSAPATVSLLIGVGPPLPWSTKEIGSKLVGYTHFKNGTFTQAGSGNFGTTSDQFRFTYQTLGGDGEITARVSKLENTGKSSRVGVMIRESLSVNSPQVFIGLSGKGDFRYVKRETKGGKNATTKSGSGKVPDTWLRLVREGNEISAYQSANGKTWTLVEEVELDLPKNCYIGLAVASGDSSKLNTSQIGKVKVKP